MNFQETQKTNNHKTKLKTQKEKGKKVKKLMKPTKNEECATTTTTKKTPKYSKLQIRPKIPKKTNQPIKQKMEFARK